MATVHARTCHLCEAACGLLITLDAGTVIKIVADPDDPLSRGHICPKGTALQDIQDDPDRLRTPKKRVKDAWYDIGWEQAFQEIAVRTRSLVEAYGPNTVAIYRGNPSVHNLGLATHGSFISKALKTKNNFSATTLDQIPHHLVGLWMYGHSLMIPVPDIDRSSYFLVLGANPMASNGSLWTVPGIKGRIEALKKRGGKLVVVDPRRTETAALGSEHIALRPGHDAAFLIGILLSLKAQGLLNSRHLEPLLVGFDKVWAALKPFSIEWVAKITGLDSHKINSLARDLGTASHPVVYGRMGVSVQSYGTLCQWLIQLINIAIGSLDHEGGMMFTTPAVDLVAITGKGSVGRHVSRVSHKPEVLGEFPAAVLAEEILTPGDGQVRALFTFAGNPVLSSPNGRQLDMALEQLELMVSVDIYMTETARHADYILPPVGPLQRSHYPSVFFALGVHNSSKYSPPLLPVQNDERHDWQIADRLARDISAWSGHGIAQEFSPDQALEMMLAGSGSGITLDALKANPHGINLGPLKPCLPEKLRTSDKKIHCAPEALLADLKRLFADDTMNGQGLRMIGRRHVRSNNSWMHNSQRLIKGPNRCTMMINPADADARGLSEGSTARVTSRVGTIELPAEITENIMPGVISIPHGFGHDRDGVGWQTAKAHAGVSINDLTDELESDPVSGNAVLNGTPVQVVAV